LVERDHAQGDREMERGRNMRIQSMLSGAAILAIATWIIVSASSGAIADGSAAGAQPEPTTGPASVPNPGSETGPLSPFEAPPELPGALQFENLSPAEQAAVEASDWPNAEQVHAAFSSATSEAAQRAAAIEAANTVGLEGLGGNGMVAP
jgi:hypothetical protein